MTYILTLFVLFPEGTFVEKSELVKDRQSCEMAGIIVTVDLMMNHDAKVRFTCYPKKGE